MKTFFIAFTMLFALNITAQEINWMSLEEALEAQKTAPKKIFIDAYTVWCGPCKMLDRNTFKNEDVVKYINKNYYAVKFNAQGDEEVTYKGKTYSNPGSDPAEAKTRNANHQLSRVFGIRAFPTLVFLDEQSNVLAPIVGYKDAQGLELYLKMFAQNDHKEMKTQEDFNAYYENFKFQFKK